MPQRIQRQRAKGWKMPANAAYVGRPSMWGNPFRVCRLTDEWEVRYGEAILSRHAEKQEAQMEAVRLHKAWFNAAPAEPGSALYNFRREYGWRGFELALLAPRLLRGKNLACFCKPNDPCHADLILRVANEET